MLLSGKNSKIKIIKILFKIKNKIKTDKIISKKGLQNLKSHYNGNFFTGPGGEIGRRRGLKIPRRKVCRFESDPGHHNRF